jgi:phage shock protein A
MRLIKRVNAILAAQLNEIVDTFEKPEQMMKQAIREMEAALQSAIESTAKAIAAEKRLRQELADCRAQAQSWRDRAAQFVRNNEEAGARRALARKIEHEKLADTLSQQLAQSEETTAHLRRQLDTLRRRLAEAKRHLASLIARQRAAEARRRFVQALGHFDSDVEAFRRFNELSLRVDEAEAEAEAQSELCGAQTEVIDCDAEIEAGLQELRRECAPGTDVSKVHAE